MGYSLNSLDSLFLTEKKKKKRTLRMKNAERGGRVCTVLH